MRDRFLDSDGPDRELNSYLSIFKGKGHSLNSQNLSQLVTMPKAHIVRRLLLNSFFGCFYAGKVRL